MLSASELAMPGTHQPESRPPRLLERVRARLVLRHYSPRTAEAYLGWIRRFVRFHDRRHPRDMGEPEVTAFLSSLAEERGVSASTQNQALAALLFLYSDVLGQDLARLSNLVHAKRVERLPVVMSQAEVQRVLALIDGVERLMASLLYGSGLRLMECVRLRVKDIDFEGRQVFVRRAKGRRDRATLLPQMLVDPLRIHMAAVRKRYEEDVARGAGFVELPDALRAKYPSAPREWVWQWVFPATRSYTHAATGERRRHHLHETVLQRGGTRSGAVLRARC